MKSTVLALTALCTAAVGCAAQGIHTTSDTTRPILLPTPKSVVWLDGRVELDGCIVNAAAGERAVQTGISQLQSAVSAGGGRLMRAAAKPGVSGTVVWVGTRHELMGTHDLVGATLVLPGEVCVPDGYVLRCARQGGRDVVICAGFDGRGCYYGLQTLIQLISFGRGVASIPRVEITDWPTYRIRLLKTSLSVDSAANVSRWADLLPRYKMNVLAGQYHVTGDSPTWSSPGRKYLANTRTLAKGGRVSGTIDPMLYVCPMTKNRGSLLDPKTTQSYVDMFRERV